MKKENIPNMLTLGRILFIPIFILLLSVGPSPVLHKIAAVICAIASITDYLDGYLARKWQVVSNFGINKILPSVSILGIFSFFMLSFL